MKRITISDLQASFTEAKAAAITAGIDAEGWTLQQRVGGGWNFVDQIDFRGRKVQAEPVGLAGGALGATTPEANIALRHYAAAWAAVAAARGAVSEADAEPLPATATVPGVGSPDPLPGRHEHEADPTESDDVDPATPIDDEPGQHEAPEGNTVVDPLGIEDELPAHPHVDPVVVPAFGYGGQA